MSDDSVEAILNDMGYTLVSLGDHWRTSAVYRGGSNKMSVKIYKSSGVWIDFGVDNVPRAFSSLVYKTVNHLGLPKDLLGRVPKSGEGSERSEPCRPSCEKIYDESILKKLVADYSFFLDRGVSKETVETYLCGVAVSGKMNGRITFPIFNQNSQIVGFCGRKLERESDRPKWKIIGKKSNWVYPAFIPPFHETDNIIADSNAVLVESIGDSLVLAESGVKNNLVLFGLNVSDAIVSYLISKNVSNITIATNNDEDGETNRGLLGAIRIFERLSHYFDIQQITIKLPLMNDFGEMQRNGMSISLWEEKKIDKAKQIKSILRICRNSSKLGIHEDKLKLFKKKLNQCLILLTASRQAELKFSSPVAGPIGVNIS
jgi:hypothetical protein